jgi:hypothetical protein
MTTVLILKDMHDKDAGKVIVRVEKN